jgi:AraC-like DNA-binding protein
MRNQPSHAPAGPATSRDASHAVFERLQASPMFKDYERAFTRATGLPLRLTATETWTLAHRNCPGESPFCAAMAKQGRTCSTCLELQGKLRDQARQEPKTLICYAGLSDTAVPIRSGHTTIAFLHTGQVFQGSPRAGDFDRVVQRIEGWGVQVGLAELRDAYFSTPSIPPRQYQSMIKLLQIFARHLEMLLNQIMIQEQHYILQHHGARLNVAEVARQVHTSTFYFCRLFRKTTGLSFTEYVSRVRVEKARELLLNPQKRISEVAFEVGFQSLPHFNRVFRKITGINPSEYRKARARPPSLRTTSTPQ